MRLRNLQRHDYVTDMTLLLASVRARDAEAAIGLGADIVDLTDADGPPDPDAARKLVSYGEYPRNEKLNVSELAAYTTVASLILNLDELLTKQ